MCGVLQNFLLGTLFQIKNPLHRNMCVECQESNVHKKWCVATKCDQSFCHIATSVGAACNETINARCSPLVELPSMSRTIGDC